MSKVLIERYLVFLFGLAIVALGVDFSIKADLGTSPITSLPYTASELWPVSVGSATVTAQPRTTAFHYRFHRFLHFFYHFMTNPSVGRAILRFVATRGGGWLMRAM